MTSKGKTKDQLAAEVKKLQRQLEILKKKPSAGSSSKTTPVKKATSTSLILKDSKWESFFKNSTNIILVVDKKGMILDINRVTKGTRKEDVVGHSVYLFVGEQFRKE